MSTTKNMDTHLGQQNLNIILEARLGSYAFGMSTPQSDIDLQGIFMLPSSDFLGAIVPGDDKFTEHKVTPEKDWTYHELAKFCRLALQCNPTVLELLWANEYTVERAAGLDLRIQRNLFLSTHYVRAKFVGYAMGQRKKLIENAAKGKPEKKKNTRHMFRLMREAEQLLSTGTMEIKVDENTKDWLFEMGEAPVDKILSLWEAKVEALKAMPSVLPDQPDAEAVNALVRNLRRQT